MWLIFIFMLWAVYEKNHGRQSCDWSLWPFKICVLSKPLLNCIIMYNREVQYKYNILIVLCSFFSLSCFFLIILQHVHFFFSFFLLLLSSTCMPVLITLRNSEMFFWFIYMGVMLHATIFRNVHSGCHSRNFSQSKLHFITQSISVTFGMEFFLFVFSEVFFTNNFDGTKCFCIFLKTFSNLSVST